MKININSTIKDKLKVIAYDESYKILFEKDLNPLDILKLGESKFLKFKTSTLESEIIVLNNMIQQIDISFNKKTNGLDVSFSTKTKDYGFVKTIKLKDKLNLVHAKGNKKRIHILHPSDFNPENEYNLLIMIDGQNMFDISKVGKYTRLNDPYRGWQIETSLKMLYDKYDAKKYIVVGIETTGVARMNELTLPSSFGELKKETEKGIADCTLVGALDKTSDFIMNTVIPYINQHYKISNFVGIGGSSAGGATSQYVGLKYHEYFRFILSLSPAMAIWTDETIEKFYKDIKLDSNKDLPYYFYNMGNRKGLEEYLNKLNSKTLTTLEKFGYDENKLFSYVEPLGEHNEIMWRYAVAYALEKITLKENNNG